MARRKRPVAASYEGRQDHIRSLETPPVETFRNIYDDREYAIALTIHEFTSLCPKTGLPDFGRLEISYCPDARCLELKSLKEYLLCYRSLGIFQENVVNRVLDDLVQACSPRWMRVEGEFNIRGGIGTLISAEYPRPGARRRGGRTR